MGLETNKAAHHIRVCEEANVKISHIGWTSCNITAKAPVDVLRNATYGKAIDSEAPAGNLPPHLPQELTFLEVDTALPKISPLPTSSAGAE
jgi:anaphase-promoting complex subunit 4